MKTFWYTCSCGDITTVEAVDKAEAIKKIKELMTVDFIARHMAEKHEGEEIPSAEEIYTLVEETIAAA
ncbi:MAG TPA: hypothetical protein VNG29_00725 [Candidatus Paceibacterota bacterium]|nr:hypothetical protein [Candidatus Paceibacterota bacterium]